MMLRGTGTCVVQCHPRRPSLVKSQALSVTIRLAVPSEIRQYKSSPSFFDYPKEGVFQRNSPSRYFADRQSLRLRPDVHNGHPLENRVDVVHKSKISLWSRGIRYLRYAVTALFAFGFFYVSKETMDRVIWGFPPEPNSPIDVKRLADLQSELDNLTLVRQLRSQTVIDSTTSTMRPVWREWPAYRALHSPSSPIASEERRRNTLGTGPYAGSGGLAAQMVFYNAAQQTLMLFVNFGGSTGKMFGFVHPGAVATVLDEGLGRVALRSTKERAVVTASLEIRFQKEVLAGQWYVLFAKLGEHDALTGPRNKRVLEAVSQVESSMQAQQSDQAEGHIVSIAWPMGSDNQPPESSRKSHVTGWLANASSAKLLPTAEESNRIEKPGPRNKAGPRLQMPVCHAVTRGLFVVPKGMELPSAGLQVKAIDDDY